MAQSIAATIDALFVACRDVVFASTTDGAGIPALVTLGPPGQYQADLLVGVGMAVRQPITRPTMGTGRSRNAEAEIDVVTSVYVPGGEEATLTAMDTTFSMQGLLETYLRTGSNNSLGGACWDAWVSSAEMSAPTIAYQALDDPNIPPVPTGRVVENTIKITAQIRY